jgi:ATP-dependent helicase HepA
MRQFVDARGKDLAALLPHERLNNMVEPVKKNTALAIIKQVHQEVEAKMTMATEMAEKQLQGILQDADQRMRDSLGAELARLEALQVHNPAIRQEELDHIRYRIEESALHISHANLQLQALRLIIST